MKNPRTRKMDWQGRVIIPNIFRKILGFEAGDILDILYVKDNDTLIIKRSEANDARCNICNKEEHSLNFKNLHFCSKCAEGIASLTSG